MSRIAGAHTGLGPGIATRPDGKRYVTANLLVENKQVKSVVSAWTKPVMSVTTLTTLGLANSSTDAISCARVLMLASSRGFECESLDDIKGLAHRHPWLAAIFLILIFSLAGIPPTVGFYAKLSVLQALIASGQSFAIPLVIYAMAMSLIAAFYYLRVVNTVKSAVPDIHVHGFTALEVTEGAKRLGEPLFTYISRLKDAGLSSLPGTAAEILDDDIRAIICSDKVNTDPRPGADCKVKSPPMMRARLRLMASPNPVPA